jgi:hypothetical protein
MMHTWCTLLETLPLRVVKSFMSRSKLSIASSMSRFPLVSVSSSIFSIVAKLTGEFASLEEPTNDSVVLTVAVYPADGSDFVESER